MPTRILAVDDSQVGLSLLSVTLAQAGYQVFTAPNGMEALKQVDRIRPDLIILDVMMPEMDGYQVCRQLRQNPNTARLPIMMLTAQDTLEEKVKGFEAGADDYVVKPFQPAELQIRIQVLLRRTTKAEPGTPAPVTEGKVIAVFSLRGGVGVSTLATNLAVSLTQLWGAPSVLIDLAFPAGHSALLLNLASRTTWGDLAKISAAEIDADLLNQVLMSHSSGTLNLATPRTAEEGELIRADQVVRVLEVLRAQHEYVVIDLPHNWSEATLAALDQADEVLLILAPELGSVMNASTALRVFDTLGYSKNKTRLALNYVIERNQLAQGAIEEALRRPVNVIIPHASEVVLTAINRGTPIVLDKFNTELGGLIEDLAFFMSKDEHRNQKPASPSQAWTRVAGRLQQRKKK